MENSSTSPLSQDSPIIFPREAFYWPATLAYIAGMLVVFFLILIIGAVVWMVSQHSNLIGMQRAMAAMPGVTIQSIAEIVVVAYVMLLLPGIAKLPLRQIGFRTLSPMQLRTVALGAIVMFVVVTPLASILQTILHFKTPEEAIAVFKHTTGAQRLAFAVFGVLLAPAFEEAIFRWVLFNAMRRWWGLWPGAVVSSLLFGLAHAQPPFTPAMFASIALPLAAGGVVLCLIYAKTNNAWASFITHGTFNALSLLLLALFPQLAK